MSIAPNLIQADRGQHARAIHLVNEAGFDPLARSLSASQRAALAGQKFTAAAGQTAIVADGDDFLAIGGVANPQDLSIWCLARLAEVLPAGAYRLAGIDPGRALFGWQMAQYRFDRYRSRPGAGSAGGEAATGPRILLTAKPNLIEAAMREARAVALVRDLVNTPAEDMGPEALEAEAEQIARAGKARFEVIRGDRLEREFPMIHAVGRAADRKHAPRLISLSWGEEKAPLVAIIGKGVTFDSGGLDIKPAAGLALMKKDMGGAAHALALARWIMEEGIGVRIHCLVPAVENAISGNAFRPGDVLQSRLGPRVEITNTDAEGRLVLADALALASEGAPDLMIDFATLTGAARVALGPDLPALFARSDDTAAAIIAAGLAHGDPLWRLPLHQPYAEYLESAIADLANAHANGFAGASVAGLFLDRFVGQARDGNPIDWAHVDTFAWRALARPGRPKGGEALGLRAAFHMIKARYGSPCAGPGPAPAPARTLAPTPPRG